MATALGDLPKICRKTKLRNRWKPRRSAGFTTECRATQGARLNVTLNVIIKVRVETSVETRFRRPRLAKSQTRAYSTDCTVHGIVHFEKFEGSPGFLGTVLGEKRSRKRWTSCNHLIFFFFFFFKTNLYSGIQALGQDRSVSTGTYNLTELVKG